jgi:uncharacterized protein YdaU (DUF1376 family)
MQREKLHPGKWFPFYSSDFIGATVGLSHQEVTTYAWMLILYYELGPFPADQVRCYRIARCESDEQKRTVDFLLDRFFILVDGEWYQKRAESEKVKMAQVSQKARDKANKRWHHDAAPHDAAALPQHSPGNARAMPATATATTTATDKALKTDPPSADSQIAIAIRPAEVSERIKSDAPQPPPCPYGELVELYHQNVPTGARVASLNDSRKGHINARWRQVWADERFDRAGGLDFFREFFARVGESKFLTGQVKGRDGAKPFQVSLPWLMNPENFLKVIEGRYNS